MTIPLGRRLLDASRDRPGWRAGKEPICHPYLVLLPVGLAMPPSSPKTRCALTAPFHPHLPRRQADYSLWRYPWGYPRRTLSGTAFPWSPDFPPKGFHPPAVIRPSGKQSSAPGLRGSQGASATRAGKGGVFDVSASHLSSGRPQNLVAPNRK
jgi:hypothetical protein